MNSPADGGTADPFPPGPARSQAPATGPHPEPPPTLLDDGADEAGALQILRRGLQASPELRNGLAVTLLLGLAVAVGRLTVPVIVQQALDAEPAADGSVDTGAIFSAAAVALLVIVGAGVLGWWTQRRLVERAEAAIANLRVRAFRHVHRLSVADHNDTKRGVLVSRVTSDAEALARFAQWGLYSWTINPAVIVGILAVLAAYSWQLALVVIATYGGVVPVLRWLQRRQLVAYDNLRTRVGEMLAAFSEAVMGAAVIRAYGAEERTRRDLHGAIDRRYRARLVANRYMAMVFVVGDAFGTMAFAAVLAVGLWQREAWDLGPGALVACLFLATMLNGPIAELAETMDQTQTAAAGWRKILNLLDHPIDVVEPEDGMGPTGRSPVHRGRRGRVRLPGLAGPGPQRRPDHHRRRHQGGRRRRDRVRQDHLRQAPVPAGRPHRGAHPAGRRGPAAHLSRVPPPVGPHGPPGRLPVRGHRGPERGLRLP